MEESTHILVVDDDASVRAMLREYLAGHGFRVGEAGNGAQMREQIDREVPDVVLLDVRLPGEDGLVLARYVRERYDSGVIMVTALNEMDDKREAIQTGADDYVEKPFDLATLAATVQRNLAMQRTALAS